MTRMKLKGKDAFLSVFIHVTSAFVKPEFSIDICMYM